MLDYKNYTVKDFINDESFRRWTLDDEAADKYFWETWLDMNLDKADVIETAQYLVLTEKDTLGDIEEIEIKEQTRNLIDKIRKEAPAPHKIVPLIHTTWFRIAASIVIAVGLGMLLYVNHGVLQESFVAGKNEHVVIKYVSSIEKSKLVTLPDGSSVILHKKSSISFPEQFDNEKREVVLSGEAFFEVTKNPSKPFYIYANGLTTKVLGTSFIISAYKKDKQVKVIVKTGKVMVFADKKGNESMQTDNQASEELTVLPNQQILFDTQENSLLISPVTEVSASHKATLHSNFEFKKRSVYEVFNVLEKYYGIKIIVDTDHIENKNITALLTDEPFGNKLKIICEAIDANYEQQSELVKIQHK